MVSKVMSTYGLSHELDNKEFAKILALNAKFAGLMDLFRHESLPAAQEGGNSDRYFSRKNWMR